jgi:hypothetical protein
LYKQFLLQWQQGNVSNKTAEAEEEESNKPGPSTSGVSKLFEMRATLGNSALSTGQIK